jgi:hypothetical protein
MAILNLTQHPASIEQVAAGVIEPADKAEVKGLLTFYGMPTKAEVEKRAIQIADLACGTGVSAAMIGGAPYLMAPLAAELKVRDIEPVYAFSERISTEIIIDGVTHKAGSFRHLGFV